MYIRHRIRYHERKAAAEAARKSKNAERMRKHRERQAQVNAARTPVQPSVPHTPRSKSKLVCKLIDAATPTTSGLLLEKNIKKSTERAADVAIADAMTEVIKKKPVKAAVLPMLKQHNKSAVSRRLKISRNLFYYTSQKGTNPRTTQETVNIITNYYNREDIITIYPNKTKSGRILKVMKYTKQKTYKKFVEEYGPLTKLTTFNRLRPRGIKLRRKSQYLQCVCDPCDNVQMISKAIRQSMAKEGLVAPEILFDELALAKSAVCDFDNFDCLDNLCSSCQPENVLRKHFDEWLGRENGVKIWYEIWDYIEDSYKGRQIKKLKKLRREGIRFDLYTELIKQLKRSPSFSLHKKNAITQLHSYKLCKANLKEDEVVVVVDFAENYVCRQYSEAQSAYYGRNSTTVHPMVVIFPSGYQISRDYVDIISNDLQHDGSAVKVFLGMLSNHLTLNYPHVKTVIVWSDGCGMQYKSRLPMYNISRNFEIPQQIVWNFFGSRHGKNESDGESAVVKSHLDIVTRAERLTISTASDCFNNLKQSTLCTPKNPTARRIFIFVNKSAIDEERASVPRTICAITHVRKIHSIRGGGGKVSYSRQSCYCDADRCPHNSLSQTSFTYPGSFHFVFMI